MDTLCKDTVRSDEAVYMIDMILRGDTNLLLTCLPVISERKNARYWEDKNNPNDFILDKLICYY